MKSRHYLAINFYWFGLAFLWQGLHPIVLPALLLSFVPEALKNTYLGGMPFAGLVLAMAIQPLAGARQGHQRVDETLLCRVAAKRPSAGHCPAHGPA